MDYIRLDMSTYKRKSHFEYFKSMAYPYVGTTVNVDITGFLEKVKKEGFPFFLSFCYCVQEAAGSVPELRQRISDDGIIEFARCRTSHTVALEDGTYCYCTLDGKMPFPDYIPYAVKEQEKARAQSSIEEESEDVQDMIFISTVPWITFTSLVQPVPMPADSNPRITWGRHFVQEGRTLMPVAVLCHHALVDGAHIGQFYKALEKSMENL